MDGYSNRVPERGGLVAQWAALSPHSKSGSSGCIKENEQRMVWPNGSSVEMTFWAFSGHYRSSYWLGERGIKQKRGGGGGGVFSWLPSAACCLIPLDFTHRFYCILMCRGYSGDGCWPCTWVLQIDYESLIKTSASDISILAPRGF